MWKFTNKYVPNNHTEKSVNFPVTVFSFIAPENVFYLYAVNHASFSFISLKTLFRFSANELCFFKLYCAENRFSVFCS